MKNIRTTLVAMFASALGLLAIAGSAHATPITADIANFSVLHLGSNPAGTGDTNDWWRFDAGQTLNLDLMGTQVELAGTQSFSMSTNNGLMGTLDLLSFSMDLDDTDGFLGGSIDYILNGAAGQFIFANQNYGSSFYNTSTMENGVFNLYIWGGDDHADLGLDLGLTAQVPEPGMLVLLLTGLAAFRLSRYAR